MGKFKVRKIGFIVGILLMLIIGFMPTPEGLTVVGQRVLGVTVLMVVFWITEAMPIPFTALLPILLFPLMGITGAKGQNDIQLFTHYAYSTCYLLVGVGFMSGAMVKHGLHKRISLGIVSKIGKKPTTLILGFIIAVAFVSMWMSNTAATVMMLPVAQMCIRDRKENTIAVHFSPLFMGPSSSYCLRAMEMSMEGILSTLKNLTM